MKKEIEQKIYSLIKQQDSLLLSSIDNKNHNQPFSSYAPYFFDVKEGVFYVLLSDLAEHTQNLTTNPLASILIIEDESNSEQIFARVRVQYDIRAHAVTEQEIREKVFYEMTESFGEVVSLIKSLSDFHVFCLAPNGGRYIEGFGKAFLISSGVSGEPRPAMKGKR